MPAFIYSILLFPIRKAVVAIRASRASHTSHASGKSAKVVEAAKFAPTLTKATTVHTSCKKIEVAEAVEPASIATPSIATPSIAAIAVHIFRKNTEVAPIAAANTAVRATSYTAPASLCATSSEIDPPALELANLYLQTAEAMEGANEAHGNYKYGSTYGYSRRYGDDCNSLASFSSYDSFDSYTDSEKSAHYM
ncbi:hypothetical protein GGI25_006527 [Coemansia spiralis]|uniref:Uncharacterized protein n=2 Tax=Coemansia TaxID=4863 RepID=A0A9W8G081_9FUNG|nr:hypothetical protein GGI25_006527 [Coemansia spiralis]